MVGCSSRGLSVPGGRGEGVRTGNEGVSPPGRVSSSLEWYSSGEKGGISPTSESLGSRERACSFGFGFGGGVTDSARSSTVASD